MIFQVRACERIVLLDPSEWGVEKKLSKTGLIERNEVAVHCVENDGDWGYEKRQCMCQTV